MQLWSIVLWPKPRARQRAHIRLQFATSSAKNKLLPIFIINVLLLITTATTVEGSTRQQGNYAGVVDAVSTQTGLSNGYTRRNYIKNYYQLLPQALAKNHQQQQPHNEAGDRIEQHDNSHNIGDGIFSHGFMGLPSDNYENSIVANGEGEKIFNIHDDTGLMPTTFTAAGQHYTASLVGLQAITDTNNANNYAMATMTTPPSSYNIDSEQQQQYGVVDNKAHQSMFGRLSNYVDPVYNVDARSNGLQNYALTYSDDAQQPTLAAAEREQFYHEPNGGDEEQQNFVNYFSKTTAIMQPTYEIENQQNYYKLNQLAEEEERKNIYNRPIFHEQTYKPKLLATTTPAPFYHSYLKQNENDKREQYPKHEIVFNNYQQGDLKQHPQQHQQQHQQQHPQQQQNHVSPHYYMKQLGEQHQQEPEMAETTHSSQFRKHHKLKSDHKSKRSDNPEITYVQEDSDEASHFQLQQLQQLQQQLHRQQQQFVNLQHQLIDHDQQLQIQKHQVHQQQHYQPPILPPISHTVHHNPYSLQALAGRPLAKHTQIIKSIPVPQHHRVLVPYKHNVSIEVPDPTITIVNKPTPIEIPVTKTIAVPDVQEVKIPIEKLLPYPVEHPVPYLVEKRVPYAVEKQVAKPVYYNVPIKVPIVHTVVHKLHKPQHGHFQENTIHDNYREPSNHHHRYRNHRLPHNIHKRLTSQGHRHGSRSSHGHSRYGGKYVK